MALFGATRANHIFQRLSTNTPVSAPPFELSGGHPWIHLPLMMLLSNTSQVSSVIVGGEVETGYVILPPPRYVTMIYSFSLVPSFQAQKWSQETKKDNITLSPW